MDNVSLLIVNILFMSIQSFKAYKNITDDILFNFQLQYFICFRKLYLFEKTFLQVGHFLSLSHSL